MCNYSVGKTFIIKKCKLYCFHYAIQKTIGVLKVAKNKLSKKNFLVYLIILWLRCQQITVFICETAKLISRFVYRLIIQYLQS